MDQVLLPNIVVRPATPIDLEQAGQLMADSARQRETTSLFMPSSRDRIEHELEQAITAGSLFLAFMGDRLVGSLSTFLDSTRLNADCSLALAVDQSAAVQTGRELLDLFFRTWPAYAATFFVPVENMLVAAIVGEAEPVSMQRELLMSIDRDRFGVSVANLLDPAPDALLDGVAGLHDRIFPHEYISGADIRSNLNGDRSVFAYAPEDHVVAYGVLRDKSDSRKTAEVVAVDPVHRGKGHGRTLLESMLAFGFGSADVRTIDLIVEADNTAAVSLYTSIGFETESENISYVLPPRGTMDLSEIAEEGN